MNWYRHILILLICAIIPVALLADPSFFWENYPVEMAQNVVLGLGTLMALYWAKTAKKESGAWYTAALLFFIAFLRELSWGRVFYVMGMDADGPIIASKSEVWFGAFINPFVGLLLLILLVLIVLNRKAILEILRLVMHDKASVFYLVAMVFFLGTASAIWDRDVIGALHPWHQGLEEFSELTSYWAALTLASRAHWLWEENH